MTKLLRLSLLGNVVIELDGQLLAGLPSRTAEALLIYLVLNERPIAREKLAELFWADRTQKQALTNLRTILTSLRRELENHLVITRQALAFNHQANVWVDVRAFEDQIKEFATLINNTPNLDAIQAQALHSVVALYQGDFLEGFYLRDGRGFDEWAALNRERLRRLARNAFHKLAYYYLENGHYRAGIETAECWLGVDAYSEDAVRVNMWLLVRAGQRNAALKKYRDLEQRLTDDLGIAPAPATTAVLRRIQTLEYPPRVNLPRSAAPFVGRHNEISNLECWLSSPETRVVTIVGPGGIGKTRLAIEGARYVAQQKPGHFLDGISFIPLVNAASAESIPTRVAESLGLALQGSTTPQQELLDYLRDREILLILDNFEHLIAPSQGGIAYLVEMLNQAPGVSLLLTSRERLNLYEEVVFEIPGLEVPPKDAPPSETFSAVALFIQNARRAQHHFAPSTDELTCITEACRLLKGLPLAIELAAGWVRHYTCGEIVDRVGESLDFLNSSFHDIPERHRSLRSVFEHSWSLLKKDEQTFFAHLAVFKGDFSLEAVQAVVKQPTIRRSEYLILQLVEKSLVQPETDRQFSIHPLLQQYAAEKLAEIPAVLELAEEKHAGYFANYLSEQNQRYHQGQTEQALTSVSSQIDNINAGLRWTVENTSFEMIDQAWEMVYLYLWSQSRFREGLTLFSQLVALARENGQDAFLGKVLIAQAEFNLWLGNYELAQAELEESLAILANQPNPYYYTLALETLGRVYYYMGDLEKAQEHFELGLQENKANSVYWLQAQMLNSLGSVICDRSADYAQARPHYQEALAIYQQINDIRGIAKVEVNLGAVALEIKDYTVARQHFEKSLVLYQQADYKHGIWAAHKYLSAIALVEEDLEVAQNHLDIALKISREFGNRGSLISTLSQLATIYIRQNKFLAAKETLQETFDLVQVDQQLYQAIESLIAAARLKAKTGDNEQALKILGFLQANNVDSQELLDQVESLMEEISRTISTEATAAAIQWGQNQTLHHLINWLLIEII